MKKRTIYPTQSQELLTLFKQTGTNVEVLCVATDYAKKDQASIVIFELLKGDWFHNNFK